MAHHGNLTAVEAAALAGCPEGTRLEVVIEPTGPAWLPIAVFFSARGHRVFRVSSQKAADLRRFLSRHAKSNGTGAGTLARLPLFDPAGLRPLQLPSAERAALDRRVRATDRLTRAAADHKRRIKDLARQLLPMTPLAGDLGVADLAVLERYADPSALASAGLPRLTALIATASHGHQGAERARQWLDAAEGSLELYAGHPAVDCTGLAAEVATELLRSQALSPTRHVRTGSSPSPAWATATSLAPMNASQTRTEGAPDKRGAAGQRWAASAQPARRRQAPGEMYQDSGCVLAGLASPKVP